MFFLSRPDFDRGLEPFLEAEGTALKEEDLSSSRKAFLSERPAFLKLRYESISLTSFSARRIGTPKAFAVSSSVANRA